MAINMCSKFRLRTAMIRRGRGVIEAATGADVIELFPATAYLVRQDALYITCVAACLLCYTRCFAHLSSIRQTEAASTVIYLNVWKSDRMCWCGRHEYHNLSEIVLAHTLTTSIVP
jgi:hypothetical protein